MMQHASAGGAPELGPIRHRDSGEGEADTCTAAAAARRRRVGLRQ
jgi:hypothetical protein